MKTKVTIFALGICLLMLGGCVASGPGYGYGGYYPPAQPYYGYSRPYYAPRTVIVAPRPVYRGGYPGEGGYRGGGYHGSGNWGGGGYRGGGGHGRGRY